MFYLFKTAFFAVFFYFDFKSIDLRVAGLPGMDNFFFEKSATHAILSFTALIVQLGFFISVYGNNYEKAYRRPLHYLILLGMAWSVLSIFAQLPIFESSKYWFFHLSALCWVQIGFAALYCVSTITLEKITPLWTFWNGIGILFVALSSVLNGFFINIEKTWYGYSASGNTGYFVAVLFFMVPPFLVALHLIAKRMQIAKDYSKQMLRTLLIALLMACTLSFTLDIVLPIFDIYVYGESFSLVVLFIIIMLCRTGLILSEYSLDIQQATRIVIEQLDEGVILLNENGQVLLANPSACALLAVREVALIGKNILPYLPGITSLSTIEGFPVPLGSNVNAITISVTMTPQSTYGIVRGYKLILRDISREANLKKGYTLLQEQFKEEKYKYRLELTRIQKILQEQDTFLVALLNNLPFRLWAKNNQGVYTKQNQLDIEIQGNKTGQTDDAYTEEEKKAIHGELLHFDTESEINEDEKKYFKNFLIPLYSDEHKQEGILGITEDITEIKLLEIERNQLKDRLLLASKMEDLNNIAGGIAHDFNNILGAQIGFCELALETMPEDLRARKYVEEILQSANRAKDLVQLLLHNKQNKTQATENFSVALVVDEVIDQLTVSCPEKIQIKKEAPLLPVQAFGDSTDFHRVLINLGTNAIFAMKEKGGELLISFKPLHLDQEIGSKFGTIPPGDFLWISVKDTGEGISPNTINRIFTPFFTTKAPNQGLGLGLPVTISLIKEAKGYLTLETAIGKGTNFCVYWPLGKT